MHAIVTVVNAFLLLFNNMTSPLSLSHSLSLSLWPTLDHSSIRLALMNSINKVLHRPVHFVHSFQNKTLISSAVWTNAAAPNQFELLMTISVALAAALKHADPSITVPI